VLPLELKKSQLACFRVKSCKINISQFLSGLT